MGNTGRRRCGWFDAVIGCYAVRINGMDCMAITKLDVLDELPEIKVCVDYELDGQRTCNFPNSSRQFTRCRTIYATLPGWQTRTSHCHSLDELDYLQFLAS